MRREFGTNWKTFLRHYVHHTVFSKYETNEMAEQRTKWKTKLFTRVTLWLLLIWLRCLLWVLQSSFLSPLIQLNARLFKENCAEKRKYSKLGQLFTEQFHVFGFANFLWRHQNVVTFRYARTPSTFPKDSTWMRFFFLFRKLLSRDWHLISFLSLCSQFRVLWWTFDLWNWSRFAIDIKTHFFFLRD